MLVSEISPAILKKLWNVPVWTNAALARNTQHCTARLTQRTVHHCKTVQCTKLYIERGRQCAPSSAVPSEEIALNCLMTGQK